MAKRVMYDVQEPIRTLDLVDIRETLKDRLEMNHYTPDLPALLKYKTQDVFVYGSLKRGYYRHNMLGLEAQALGSGFTVSNDFNMHRVHKEVDGRPTVDYPVITIGGPAKSARIFGEVWRVPSRQLVGMDFYESNTMMYKRLKLAIEMFQGKESFIHYCWVYVGLKHYWHGERLKHLLPCETFVRTKAGAPDPYYIYIKRHDLSSRKDFE